MSALAKANCWEALDCGYGPGSREPCPAVTDATSDGVNGGLNAGRICWTVPGTHCFARGQTFFADKLDACLVCPFLKQVRAEQGDAFQLLKLGQGLHDEADLRAVINRLESFLRVPEQLHAGLDLRRLVGRIAREAERAVAAQRCVVFLVEGDPPQLRGEFLLRGEIVKVAIPLDETSAVGAAVVRGRVINLRNPYDEEGPADDWPTFSPEFDSRCEVRTRSLLAVPIPGSDGRPVGVVTAANSVQGSFSPDDQWFLGSYAVQIGLALEKARLLEDSVFVGRLASVGETMAALSHRLKGITHALRGLAYVIREATKAERPQDVSAACEILDRQVQRIVDLSIAVAAYEAERSEEPATADVSEVVADVVGLMREEAQARAVVLEACLPDAPNTLVCDRIVVYRCLVNLLAHVLNRCPPTGGCAKVRTAASECGDTVIEVSVGGPGYRAAPLAEPAPGEALAAGSGTGLPTVIALAQAHGGYLETLPSGDQGTIYRLLLPRPPCPTPPPSPTG